MLKALLDAGHAAVDEVDDVLAELRRGNERAEG